MIRSAASANRESFASVLMHAAVEASPDGILSVNRSGKVIILNRQFAEMWHVPPEMVKEGFDQPVRELVTSQVRDPLGFVARIKFLYAHPSEVGHDEIETLDGRTIDRHSTVIFDNDARELGRIWFFRDISDHKAAELKVLHLAQRDPLTGLANRLFLMDRLDRQVSLSRQSGQAFAVLFLDLDRFKAVNDSLGHAAGDLLLQQVAGRIQENIRSADIVARIGGDEFVILQLDLAHPEARANLAGRLVRRLAEPFDLNGREVGIGASIGIVLAPQDGDNSESLLHNCDVAMYQAKAKGRNNYCFYQSGMNITLSRG